MVVWWCVQTVYTAQEAGDRTQHYWGWGNINTLSRTLLPRCEPHA